MKNNLPSEIQDSAYVAGSPPRSVAFRPLNLTGEALKDLIRTMPEKSLLLGIVYVEDIYETRFGDGFYSYAERAFFSLEAAEKCAAWITAETTKEVQYPGYCGRAKLEKIELDPAGNLLSTHERSLLAQLNGNDDSWVSTVNAHLGKEVVEPDFGDVPTNPRGDHQCESHGRTSAHRSGDRVGAQRRVGPGWRVGWRDEPAR